MKEKNITIRDLNTVLSVSDALFYLKTNTSIYSDFDTRMRMAGNPELNSLLDQFKRVAHDQLKEGLKWPTTVNTFEHSLILDSVRLHLEGIQEWKSEFEHEEKRQIVTQLLDPYFHDEPMINSLVEYANKYHEEV